MKKSKRAKLEAAGWAVGSVQDFLGLSDAETALIEMKLALSRTLRDRRQRRGVSQVELAKRLRSSPSLGLWSSRSLRTTGSRTSSSGSAKP